MYVVLDVTTRMTSKVEVGEFCGNATHIKEGRNTMEKNNAHNAQNTNTPIKGHKENSSIEPSASLGGNEKGKVKVETCSSPKKKFVVSWVEHRKDGDVGDEGNNRHGIVGIYDDEEEAEQELWDDMVITIQEAGLGCYFDYRHISYTNVEFWWYINEIAA